MNSNESNLKTILAISGGVVGLMIITVGLFFAYPAYSRYQNLAYANNQTQINEIKIQQTAQLVEVERQKAQIRIVEAGGISESQHIINATLSDKYLQHEAINAQREMANSPNHTTIYIPSGQNGVPLVKTLEDR